MQAPGKLPVLRIVAASYGFVLLNAREVLRVIWLPFVAMAALDVFYAVQAPVHGPEDGEIPPLDFSILFALAAQLFVTVTVLVAWHRRVLLGADALPPGFPLSIGVREGRFFGRLMGIAVVLLMFHVFAATGFVAFVLQGSAAMRVLGIAGLTGVILAEVYLASRLLLILPAMAVDSRFTFGDAWRVSAGNGWRLALAWFLTMLPVLAVEIAILAIAIFSESREFAIGSAIVTEALSLLNMILGATALSLCFTQLGTGRDDEETPY